MKLIETSEVDGNGFRRTPMLAHNRAESAALLSNPKGKLSRGQRKALHLARSYRLTPEEPIVPRAEPVRLALKCRTLTMRQLGRRLSQFARRAATAKYILAKMTTYSPFRSRVQATQDGNLAAFKQVDAEVDARLLAVKGKLAEAL